MFAMRLPKLDREHWPCSLILAVAAVLYIFAGISVTSLATPESRVHAMGNNQYLPQVYVKLPPSVDLIQFRELSPEGAMVYNASIPVSKAFNPAAHPFILYAFSTFDRRLSLECLTAAIYYEAATESMDGQRAVAQVVLNRVRHPAFPSSICGVVFQGSERSTGCQFTFTCDGSLGNILHPVFWSRARAVAEEALAGKVYAPVGWATHYHTKWVVPYWSSSLVKLANVGSHIFYRWAGGWGQPAAFVNKHNGTEPVHAKMRYIGIGGAAEEIGKEEALQIGSDFTRFPAGSGAAGGDFTKRAIIRRYEPVKREDIAASFAKQTPADAKANEGYRWALTGEGASKDAFGKKPAPAAPPLTSETTSAR